MSRRKKPVVINGIELWRCARCGTLKEANHFGVDSRALTGLLSYCRPCVADIGREYTADPAVREAHRQCERRRRRRIRKKQMNKVRP